MSIVSSYAGSVPVNYDKYLGPVLFEPYALELAHRLQNDKLNNVLEIACGTGRLTKHLVNLIAPGGQLTATDLNADMIELAKTRVTGNVQWQVADAQNLPYRDKTFDHVVCQFGVMFFPNKQLAFAQAYRVLQPNGKFIFSTWDELKNNPGANKIRTIMDEVLQENAPDFLMKGPYSFYDTTEIKSLLEAAGFKDIRHDEVNLTSSCACPEDFCSGFVYGTPLDAYLSKIDAAGRQSLEKQFREGIAAEFGEHHLQIPMKGFVFEARR